MGNNFEVVCTTRVVHAAEAMGMTRRKKQAFASFDSVKKKKKGKLTTPRQPKNGWRQMLFPTRKFGVVAVAVHEIETDSLGNDVAASEWGCVLHEQGSWRWEI